MNFKASAQAPTRDKKKLYFFIFKIEKLVFLQKNVEDFSQNQDYFPFKNSVYRLLCSYHQITPSSY